MHRAFHVVYILRLSHAGGGGGRRATQHIPNNSADGRRADRLAAADPQRPYRAAHVPFAGQSFRQRPCRAGATARSCQARRRGGSGPHLQRGRRAPRARALSPAWRKPGRTGRNRLSAATRRGRQRAAIAGRPRRAGGADAADDGGGRFAQCIGCRTEIRGQACPRSGPGRLCHCLGTGAWHRSGGASRKPRQRHGRCAGRWP